MIELKVGEDVWHANCYGEGETCLLSFHGYGQDSSYIKHFEELLGDKYRLVCIDLAFHGKNSNLRPELLFDKAYGEAFLNAFLAHFQTEKIGLFGYSIGARISLSLCSWYMDKVSEIWLLAPDGMPVNKTYFMLSGTWIGKTAFKSFINNPGWGLGLIKLGKGLKILNHKVAAFYLNEVNTKEKRAKLFKTWMTYRKTMPELGDLKKKIEASHLAVTCIVGKWDKVIPPKRTKKFARKNLYNTEIIELAIGHNLLSTKGVRLLQEFWK